MDEVTGFPLDRAARRGLSLRAVRADDMAFLSALYATTRADELVMTGWPEATKSLFVVQQFTAQHAEYLSRFPDAARTVVERGGAAIGRLYVNSGEAACHLIDITLLPAQCGHGFGTALLGDLQDHAARLGKPLTLSVLATNPARRLYDRAGFRTSETGASHNRMVWKPSRNLR